MLTTVKHKGTRRLRISFSDRANEVLSFMRYMTRHSSIGFVGEFRWQNLCDLFFGEMGSVHPGERHLENLHVALKRTRGVAHIVLDEEQRDILFVLPDVYVGGEPLSARNSNDFHWASKVFAAAERVYWYQGNIRSLAWIVKRMDVHRRTKEV